MILAPILHFDLCFGGEGGMPGLSHALVPELRSPRGGRLDIFYFCLSLEKKCARLFDARKRQEKLDMQISEASPVYNLKKNKKLLTASSGPFENIPQPNATLPTTALVLW